MRNEFMKKLIKIVIPIAFQQLMLSLVSVSDAIMLGRLSQNSLAAVSLASQVSFVENLFLAAMTIGFSIFGAQYWGKKDKEAFAQIFAYVMKVTISIAFLFFLAAACIPQRLMQIFTNDRILLKGGAIYLRVVSSAYLLTGISQIYLCMLKNSGRSSKSIVISSASVFINIILNGVFIFGLTGFPQMRIAGAALATVNARFIEVLWCIFETAKSDCIKLSLQNGGGNNKAFHKNFWKYTNPVLSAEEVL